MYCTKYIKAGILNETHKNRQFVSKVHQLISDACRFLNCVTNVSSLKLNFHCQIFYFHNGFLIPGFKYCTLILSFNLKLMPLSKILQNADTQIAHTHFSSLTLQGVVHFRKLLFNDYLLNKMWKCRCKEVCKSRSFPIFQYFWWNYICICDQSHR